MKFLEFFMDFYQMWTFWSILPWTENNFDVSINIKIFLRKVPLLRATIFSIPFLTSNFHSCITQFCEYTSKRLNCCIRGEMAKNGELGKFSYEKWQSPMTFSPIFRHWYPPLYHDEKIQNKTCGSFLVSSQN